MPVASSAVDMQLVRRLPKPVKNFARWMRDMRGGARSGAFITEPVGRLVPSPQAPLFIAVVGRRFDQRKPDAMMTCRMGYCRAFETLGVPYLICDWRNLRWARESWPQSFALVFGADVPEIDAAGREALQAVRHAVWVNPWFDGERTFFAAHGLPAETWVWSEAHRTAVLELRPRFGFTATVPSGLQFFTGWERSGLPVRSLPLACDTTLYSLAAAFDPGLANVDLAFVGGYWESKGKQLDRYLRPFEDRLVIYGYNRWPYSGYRGCLPREREPALYRQAGVCPVINEPTVALLKGQINERVFKVLGAGGAPVVDAVPAYRELFTAAELPIPATVEEFAQQVQSLLSDPAMRAERIARGRAAVLARHTYVHRARALASGLQVPLPTSGALG